MLDILLGISEYSVLGLCAVGIILAILLVMGIKKVNVENALGRIFADLAITCPPAVPIAVCGDKIDKETIDCFKYYGINACSVVKE